MVLAVNEDSVTSGIKSGERTYHEISSGLLFRSFVEQIDGREVFDSIGRRPDQPYDYILNFRIERLRRRPVSSPEDMWLEVSLDLRDRQQRGSLWTERFAIPVESRELGPRRKPDELFFRLLTHLAARKLAATAAGALTDVLVSVNPDKLYGVPLRSCPARSVIWLEIKGLPLPDKRAVLRALSRSSCYDVVWVSADSVASPDPAKLLIEARADPNDLIHLRLWLPETGFKEYREAWQAGDAWTREAVLQDVQSEITAYHHRSGACVHAKSQ